MARVTTDDVAKLEEKAAKAKAVYETKSARVKRALQKQREDHERAVLRLLKSLGLLDCHLEFLRGPLTSLAEQILASSRGGANQGNGSTAQYPVSPKELVASFT